MKEKQKVLNENLSKEIKDRSFFMKALLDSKNKSFVKKEIEAKNKGDICSQVKGVEKGEKVLEGDTEVNKDCDAFHVEETLGGAREGKLDIIGQGHEDKTS